MKNLSLFFLAMLCCVSTSLRASELTIASTGTDDNSNIPLDGANANFYYQRAQIIYEAAGLSAMIGSQINQMTFHLRYSETTTWGSAQFKVSLAEVAATSFGSVDGDAAFNSATLTPVYSGGLSVDGKELTILFDDPFVYSGGNLLFDFQLTQKGAMQLVYFLGVADAEGPIRGILGESYSSIGSSIASVDKRARMTYKTTFSYGPISTCTKPTGLIAHHVTYNSATIGWTTEEVESYTLEYKLSSASEWTVVENATNGHVLNGLTENSTYNVRIKAKCSEESVSSYAATSFTTPCSPQPTTGLPYTYDFEKETVFTIPTCWDKIANGNYPCVYSGGYNSDHSLYFSGGTTVSECVIILPKYETPYNGLTLSFWYKNGVTLTNYPQAQIGYLTDKRFASTFHSIRDLDRVTEYTHVENVSLASIPSNDYYLAIRLGGEEISKNGSLYIDDIVVASSTPTCSKPTGLTIDDITYNSATVTWDKGSATTSVLEYKRSDAAEWTIKNPATSPYALAGLEANTSYDVRVKNSCDEIGESDYCATSTFTTPCAPFYADSENPFSEDFAEVSFGKIPACWDNSEDEAPYFSWGGNYTDGRTENNRYIYCKYGEGNSGHYAFLKTLDIHIASKATLSFWYKNTGAGDFSVYYSVDGGDKKLLESGLTNQTEWIEYSKALPDECIGHNIVLAFKGTSVGDDGCYINIDDILVTCEETCPRPTNLATAVTDNSVDVTWTAGASETEWQYICQPSADPVNWNGSAVKSATSASVNLADLEPATNYTFYLRAKCAADDLSAVVSKDFKTECAASISSLTCGFEESEGYTSGELPECWNTINAASTPIVTTEGTPASGTQHLRITGSTSGQIVILPRFNQEVKNLQISFKFKRTSGAALYLASVTDPANTSSWNVFTNSFSEGYDSYTAVDEYELTKARNGDYYLAFFYYTSGDATLYIDDIVVEPIPTCKAPMNLYVSTDPTATTVGLNWTENGPAEEWLIQVSYDNGETWDAGTEAYTRPFTLTGLTPDTEYKARVKAVCGPTDSSKWSNIIDFTTEEDTSTALDNTSAEAAATKLLRNGQVLINRNGILYTLTGQEVK